MAHGSGGGGGTDERNEKSYDMKKDCLYGMWGAEQTGEIYASDDRELTDSDEAYDTDTKGAGVSKDAPLVWSKEKYKIIPKDNFLPVTEFNEKFFEPDIRPLLGKETWHQKEFHAKFLKHATPESEDSITPISVLGGGNDKVVFFHRPDPKPIPFASEKIVYDNTKCYKMWGTFKKFTRAKDRPDKAYGAHTYRVSPRLNDLIHALGTVGHPNLANYKVYAAYIPGSPERPVCFGAKCDFYPGTLGATFFNITRRRSWQTQDWAWVSLRWWLHQLFEAVGFMHVRGIAHRAIELDTVYIDRDFNVKLGNFNHSILATMESRQPIIRHHVCNHLNYRAPEMCVKREARLYDARDVDNWALGCVMIGLLGNLEPFQGKALRGTTRVGRKYGHTHFLNQSEQALGFRHVRPDYKLWADPTKNVFAIENGQDEQGNISYDPMPAAQIEEKVADFLEKQVDQNNKQSSELCVKKENYKEVVKGLLMGEPELRWGVFQALNTDYFKNLQKPDSFPSLAQPSAYFNKGHLISIGIRKPKKLLKFMETVRDQGWGEDA